MEDKKMEMCRTCLGNSTTFSPLFSEENYPDQILIIAGVDVKHKQNDFPMFICSVCIESITCFIKFRIKIQECNKLLEDIQQEIADECDKSNESIESENDLNGEEDEKLDEGNLDDSDEDQLNERDLDFDSNEDDVTLFLNENNSENDLNKDNSNHVNLNEDCSQDELNEPRQIKSIQSKFYLRNVINRAIPKSSNYKCEKCNRFSTKSQYELYIHLVYKVCDPEGPVQNPDLPNGLYSCDECQYITQFKSHLRYHKEGEHLQRVTGYHTLIFNKNTSNSLHKEVFLKKIINSVIPESSNYKCTKCNEFSTKRQYELYIHLVYKVCDPKGPAIDPELPEGLYGCDKCQYVTQFKTYMECHKKYEHIQKIRRGPDGKQKVSCNICGKVVAKEYIRYHMYTHDDKINCPVCNKLCTRVSFRTHLRMHKRKDCICEICGKFFKYEGLYIRHKFIHRNKKRHNCNICKASTTDMKRHMLSHTGETPYTCQICDKGLRSGWSLKTHMRLHTGERPYKCTFCDSSFPINVSLQNHLKIHHQVI